MAREVGTDGKLGGQRTATTSRDLVGPTDNVNFMASNLTGQVLNIARWPPPRPSGDLSKKITGDAKARTWRRKTQLTPWSTVNGFVFKVTGVAREVGTEGKLGGQAQLKGVAGTFKDFTDP